MLKAIRIAISKYWIIAGTVALIFFGGWESSLALFGYEARKQAYEQSAKGEPFNPAEERIALWTVVLGIFTGVLAVSTLMLWAAGEKQISIADRSAQAAIEASKNFSAKERAMMTVSKIAVQMPTDISGLAGRDISGKVWLTNIGPTSARVEETNIRFEIASNISAHDFTIGYNLISHGLTVALPEGKIDTREVPVRIISNDEAVNIGVKKAMFFVIGKVTYLDVFDRRWTRCFCLDWKGGDNWAPYRRELNAEYEEPRS